MAALIVLVIDELFFKFKVIVLMLSQVIAPSSVWLSAFNVTFPPLEPWFPHFDVAAAFNNTPEPFFKVAPFKLISESVFVIKNNAVYYA